MLEGLQYPSAALSVIGAGVSLKPDTLGLAVDGVTLLQVEPLPPTPEIVLVGDILSLPTVSTAQSGTVSSTIAVPDAAQIVVVGVSSFTGINNGHAAMTFTKGGVDTAMTRVGGADGSGGWQTVLFYLVQPDIGADKSLKWDWAGVSTDQFMVVSVAFFGGIDAGAPVRDAGGAQGSGFPINTAALDAEAGDAALGWSGFFYLPSDEGGDITAWNNLSFLAKATHVSYGNGFWAMGAPGGPSTFGVQACNGSEGGLCVAVLARGAPWPSASTTGVTPGTVLTPVVGDFFTSANDEVVEALNVSGTIIIQHTGVTVRNCMAQAIVDSGTWEGNGNTSGSNATIEDCTISRVGGTTISFWGGANALIQRCDISGAENGVWMQADGITFRDSYLHDFLHYNPVDDPHIDGVQVPAVVPVVDSLSILNNNFDFEPNTGVSSCCTIGGASNITISRNRFVGETIALYLNGADTTGSCLNNNFIIGDMDLTALVPGAVTFGGNYGPGL